MQRFSVASVLLLLTLAQTMAETNKQDKKQMRKYVEKYVPAEYEKIALREQNLSRAHGNAVIHGSGSSIELLEQAAKDHQSHNKQNTSKAEKKQMIKYVEEYVPAGYQKKALREEGLRKGSNHGNSDSSSEGEVIHGSGSSIELLEQAPQGHQSYNKQNTSKTEKKQMKTYVEEYVPEEYQKKALRDEGLSKESNHRSSEGGAIHGSGSSIELLEQAPQDHQSHNKQNTSKSEKKQMRTYVEEYVPEEYQKKALRDEGLSKDSHHRSAQGGAMHGSGSGSSVELLEQAPQDHQSHNKQNTSKSEKKQMRTYVGEYVPEEYQKKALREEGLSKGTDDNHKEGKDGKMMTVSRTTFLSSNFQVFATFNLLIASLVFAAFMGAAYLLFSVVFKKRSAYQAVNFPESTLG